MNPDFSPNEPPDTLHIAPGQRNPEKGGKLEDLFFHYGSPFSIVEKDFCVDVAPPYLTVLRLAPAYVARRERDGVLFLFLKEDCWPDIGDFTLDIGDPISLNNEARLKKLGIFCIYKGENVLPFSAWREEVVKKAAQVPPWTAP